MTQCKKKKKERKESFLFKVERQAAFANLPIINMIGLDDLVGSIG